MPSLITASELANYSSTSGCCQNETPCQSSLLFFSKISDKLLIMVESLKRQFEECRSKCVGTPSQGAILVSVDAPQVTLGVRYEFIEYIKRYGPPVAGIFDENLLNILRQQLGL
jgi:hypothetical protein